MRLTGKLAERSKARQSAGVILPAVKTGMLKDYGLDTSRRWDIVHPSELSHQSQFCPRAVFLRITKGPVGPAEKFDFIRENIFEEGNQIHTKWQNRLRRYTDLWGDWYCLVCKYLHRNSLEPAPASFDLPVCLSQAGHVWLYAEVGLDAEDEALLCGHADGAFGNSLAEFKSMGTGTLRIEAPTLYARHMKNGLLDLQGLWRDINRPLQTHLNQGDIYLWIAQLRGLPFNQISYVYESKWNQQVKEFVIEYSEERSQKLVAQAKVVKEAVQSGRAPDCKFPGKCAGCLPYDSRPPARTVRDRG
jgi:hypothetical protein